MLPERLMDWHHPIVASVLLPLGVAAAVALLAGLSRRLRESGAAATLACGLAVTAAAFALLGADWPALSVMRRLPWAIAAGGALGGICLAFSQRRLPIWLVATLGWAAIAAWLAPSAAAAVLPIAAGAALIVLLFRQVPAAAALTTGFWTLHGTALVAFGAAATMFGAGSLALAQLAAAIGFACVGAAVAAWSWRGLRVARATALVGITGLLALYQAALATIDTAPVALLSMILALIASIWTAASAARRTRIAGLMLTLFLAAGAAGWQMFGPSAVPGSDDTDDPYR